MENCNKIVLTDEMARELPIIKARAIRNGTFMQAPNGGPSNLDEQTWLAVRTQAYKRAVGDWELQFKNVTITTAPQEHGFASFAEARDWAKRNIVNTYNNDETGWKWCVTIHRLYGAANLNGSIYRVKVTLKEDKTSMEANVPHSYEATKIELMAGTLGNSDNSLSPNTNNSISVAKLLNGVEKSYEKGKKLLEDYSVTLDANGEPMAQCIPATLE